MEVVTVIRKEDLSKCLLENTSAAYEYGTRGLLCLLCILTSSNSILTSLNRPETEPKLNIYELQNDGSASEKKV